MTFIFDWNLIQILIFRRLERGKSREFENLEYLKNVVLNFITTTDTEGKKKMLNAIGAVLKFDSTEINSVNTFLNKKK